MLIGTSFTPLQYFDLEFIGVLCIPLTDFTFAIHTSILFYLHVTEFKKMLLYGSNLKNMT